MTNPFSYHEVSWNNEKVSRFWDFFAKDDTYNSTWFTNMVGDAIINYSFKDVLAKRLPELNVLDYATGKGFLARHLLACGVNLSVCDFSEEAIQQAKVNFSQMPNFCDGMLIRKFPTPFPNNTFDFIFLIEAVEHLVDEYFEATIRECRRILKNGGKLVVTTPNAENLCLSKVCCPDCGAIFHRFQHVRSFDKQLLKSSLESFGFYSLSARG